MLCAEHITHPVGVRKESRYTQVQYTIYVIYQYSTRDTVITLQKPCSVHQVFAKSLYVCGRVYPYWISRSSIRREAYGNMPTIHGPLLTSILSGSMQYVSVRCITVYVRNT